MPSTAFASSATAYMSVGDLPGVTHQSPLVRLRHHCGAALRMLRARSCLAATVLLFIFAAIIVKMVSGTTAPEVSNECDQWLAPPHAPVRPWTSALCYAHDSSENANLAHHVLPRADSHNVSFVVVGDWGRDGFCCQNDVAAEMDRAAHALSASFVINAGDSFYEEGLLSPTETQVKTSWVDVYTNETRLPYLSKLPWFGVLGNHDYRGDALALPALSQIYPQWIMPARWYDRVIAIGPRASVHLVFIDTSPFIAAYRLLRGYTDAPNGIQTQWSLIPAQLAWLNDTLRASNATVKIVVGHHPIFSSGFSSLELGTFMRTNLTPLFEQYNVLAYLSGHEHNLQAHVPKDNPRTSYFISGAGSKIAGFFTKPDDGFQFYFDDTSGFLVVTVSIPDNPQADEPPLMVATFLDAKGNIVQTMTKTQQPQVAS